MSLEQELQLRYQREAERSQRTIFACQIHPKNDERDLFEFFSEAGRVVDIQLLRDSRTYRSKGLAYIEFKDREAVPTALSFSGKQLGGYPIIVQLTQAEKNIAAQAAAAAANAQTPLRLRVKNLPRKVTEEDIHPVFSAFGEIIDIYLKRADGDERTGYVEFRRESEAIAAMGQLNGLEILGKKIVCEIGEHRDPADIMRNLSVPDITTLTMNPGSGSLTGFNPGLEDESGNGGLALTAERRTELMQKLHGGAFAANPDPAVAPNVKAEQGKVSLSPCLLLRNMFNPATETEADFDLDIREDVMEEVQKYGTLRHIYVDKVSSDGLVYLKFAETTGAKNTTQALNGRWFAQNQIKCEYMDETAYSNMFPDI